MLKVIDEWLIVCCSVYMSASTWQSYSLSTRFYAILHFLEVLVFLMNDGFHVDVCCWVTDYQLLNVVSIAFTALYRLNHLWLHSSKYLILFYKNGQLKMYLRAQFFWVQRTHQVFLRICICFIAPRDLAPVKDNVK